MFVANRHLSQNEYFAGDEYTIADMACWPWLAVSWNTQYDKPLDSFEHLNRWFQQIKARPAVKRITSEDLDEWMRRTDHVGIPPERWANSFGDNFHAFHRKGA